VHHGSGRGLAAWACACATAVTLGDFTSPGPCPPRCPVRVRAHPLSPARHPVVVRRVCRGPSRSVVVRRGPGWSVRRSGGVPVDACGGERHHAQSKRAIKGNLRFALPASCWPPRQSYDSRGIRHGGQQAVMTMLAVALLAATAYSTSRPSVPARRCAAPVCFFEAGDAVALVANPNALSLAGAAVLGAAIAATRADGPSTGSNCPAAVVAAFCRLLPGTLSKTELRRNRDEPRRPLCRLLCCHRSPVGVR
jgi:hypothetical protein